MKVIAIAGSPRLKGNTNYLVDQALDVLEKRGIETEKIILNQCKIGWCQAHDNCAELAECPQKDDAGWILEKYKEADGIIIASPVYFGTISAQVKTFMDRSIFLFRHQTQLKAKCAGLIAIAGRGGYEEAAEELGKFTRGMENVFVLKGPAGPPGTPPEELTELIEKACDLGNKMADVLTA
jgi:multimeric flavodoxin WrbA